MSRYFQDDYGRWVRRLLTLSGAGGVRYLDLTLTEVDELGWSRVKEGRLRVHRCPHDQSAMLGQLPTIVMLEMQLHLGSELADRLATENFVTRLGWSNIQRTSTLVQGGVPIKEVPRTELLLGQPRIGRKGLSGTVVF